MSETDLDTPEPELAFECVLDAPPEKVWRAISQSELRERWLPGSDLKEPHPSSIVPDREISFVMQERQPPFLESTVTFQIEPEAGGNTVFRIIHRLIEQPESLRSTDAANENGVALMLAA
ncbi:SRPBCC domain-containing protein [uncultured Roseibium sp.]|uniref:SRPBCC family protein n=1 Tax=uncultured Roseibium sp. TaxID=1936171 RepID=UPI00262D438D|nr:SRPBCC domain-containing protein [uncultured Roseibium sp.]